MSNTLFTSSSVNLPLFAFSLKFIVLLKQSLSKSSFFLVILVAASLFVCYLQGTAVPGTAPSSCWAILTLLWERAASSQLKNPKNCPFYRSYIFLVYVSSHLCLIYSFDFWFYLLRTLTLTKKNYCCTLEKGNLG